MFQIRPMREADRAAVAELIYLSTNSWYLRNRGYDIFRGGPEVCGLFCEVYGDLDPGHALVAEHSRHGFLIGSCFVHPRETHISLGILNVHPSYFGDGVGAALVDEVIALAEREHLPLRLVSSALNLDSFSLYNRKGFVPRAIYQDLFFSPPLDREIPAPEGGEGVTVRPAELADVAAMGRLELEVAGISRSRDYRYFVENRGGRWHTLAVPSPSREGELDGFLVSVDDPGSRLIGPGVARTPLVAAVLAHRQLERFKGKNVVCLAPSDQPELVQALYQMGGRNCELHFAQVRGQAPLIHGIVMPTFMPESG